MSFHPCQSIAGVNEPGAQEVIKFLDQRNIFNAVSPNKISTKELEIFIKSNPVYQLKHGDTEGIPILCALYKNRLYEYVPSVLKMGDKNLIINHGDNWGLTALFYAIVCDPKNITEVKKLIAQGGDLFSLTTFPKQIPYYEDNQMFYQVIPEGASILWAACETRSASDVKVLLQKGALFNYVNGVMSPPLSEQGEKTYAKAQAMLNKFNQLLLQSEKTYFHLVPRDVLNEVAKYMETSERPVVGLRLPRFLTKIFK